jgi:D-alanyl-lipoteichoic acid acyltransferase DltB (MBOAT superfamily)
MMPQFHALPVSTYDWHRACMGLTLLSIGLFKKVILADELSQYATPAFDAADAGHILSMEQAWSGALSYTLQLYFDFSAYSDMAIGIGLMFMIRLPTNFLSPYKATSIIDFWQRWHITLSSFLKDYLYIPLGGNRKGELRRYLNLLITMLLGGLWHGAGWTFVIWGGLHGLYLVVNHMWRKFIGVSNAMVSRCLAWSITMFAVIVAWVFFRAKSVEGAVTVLQGMAGLHAEGNADVPSGGFPLIMLTGAIALLFPNAMQMIAHAEGAGDKKWYSWSMSNRWMLVTVLFLLISLYTIVYTSNRISEFIYFQF